MIQNVINSGAGGGPEPGRPSETPLPSDPKPGIMPPVPAPPHPGDPPPQPSIPQPGGPTQPPVPQSPGPMM